MLHRQPEMPLIQRARMKPPLPQVPAAPAKTVDVLRVAKMRPADGPRQRILLVRNCHYMHVIAHQTIADYLQAIFLRLVFQEFQIHPPVVIGKEYILAIITPLSNMMGKSNCNCSG